MNGEEFLKCKNLLSGDIGFKLDEEKKGKNENENNEKLQNNDNIYENLQIANLYISSPKLSSFLGVNCNSFFLKIAPGKLSEKKYEWLIYKSPFVIFQNNSSKEFVVLNTDNIEVIQRGTKVSIVQLPTTSNKCISTNLFSYKFKTKDRDLKMINSATNKNCVSIFLLSVKLASSTFPLFTMGNAYYYKDIIFNPDFLIPFSRLDTFRHADTLKTIFNDWFALVRFNISDVITHIIENDIENRRLEFVFNYNCFSLLLAEEILSKDNELVEFAEKANYDPNFDFKSDFAYIFDSLNLLLESRILLCCAFMASKKIFQTRKNVVFVVKTLLAKGFFSKRLRNLDKLKEVEECEFENVLMKYRFMPIDYIQPTFDTSHLKMVNNLIEICSSSIETFLRNSHY